MSGLTERLERMNLKPRLAQHGRIRLGTRTEKGHPTKLKTIRFSSSDRVALERIAAVYGGQVNDWDDPRSDDAYDLITESERVRVQLPPDPLGDTPIMQMWDKGVLLRTCDVGDPSVEGEQGCLVQGPNGDRIAVTCKCLATGEWKCKAKTNLSVILPDTDFGGVWRLSTGSLKAARELPAMVSLIEQVQTRTGLPSGWLLLEQESSGVGKDKHRYAVPRLILDQSLGQASGEVEASETRVAIGPVVGGELGEIDDQAWDAFVAAAQKLDNGGRMRLKGEAKRLGRASVKRADMDAVTVAALTLFAEDLDEEGIVEAELMEESD